ncbi:Salivary gland secretion 1 [Rhodotorula toruloides ATCC 204091]|uniref:Salivary gland secretion 1 n=1 Tax=Rhodotorula toruloides TaxID=5286 RepID=A0A2T0ABG5_RHOTO|nr:Salivary gland secretion 1 [Rhodotorula toruloides ATCC 204091]PRQ75337.1 salivary gland secretion 1 [Rhodotorula toruloides]
MSASPPPPRASLDGLPIEIKTRIIELCDRQDKWLAELHRYLKTYAEERESWNDDLPQGTSKMLAHCEDLAANFGSTVAVLFQLNRSWSSLAAPFRFKVRRPHSTAGSARTERTVAQTIKVSRTAGTLFQLYIAPKYGRCFRQIDFDEDTPNETFRSILALLPYFPHLVDARLSNAGFSDFLPGHSTRDDDQLTWYDLVNQAPMGLGRLLNSLVTLETDANSENSLSRIIKITRNLRSLRLTARRPSWSGEHFVQIIAKLPLLLDLEVPPTTSADILKDVAAAAVSLRLPRLTSYTGPLHSDLASSLALPSAFASSLRRLTFKINDEFEDAFEDDGEPLWPSDTLFPHVRSLTIKTTHDENVRALGGVSPQRFPSITSVHVQAAIFADTIESSYGLAADYLCANFSRTGTLRHVRLSIEDEPFRAHALDSVDERIRLPGISVSTNPMEPFVHWAFFSATADRQGAQDGYCVDGDRAAELVDRTMDFLTDWHRRAAETDDDGAYARLAVVLQRGELERVAMLG